MWRPSIAFPVLEPIAEHLAQTFDLGVVNAPLLDQLREQKFTRAAKHLVDDPAQGSTPRVVAGNKRDVSITSFAHFSRSIAHFSLSMAHFSGGFGRNQSTTARARHRRKHVRHYNCVW
ncbi:MAG: hypothetical protein Q8K82_16285 [Gemmatimonadaceae bacterium]|nr:hypothetical protein [Gemmatimonadaceae bacterium]